MKKTLQLSNLKNNDQSLYLITDKNVVDYKKLASEMKNKIQVYKYNILNNLFKDRTYFKFIGSCNKINNFIDYHTDIFTISFLGKQNCIISGLPSFSLSHYKKLKLVDCGRKKFILNIATPFVKEFDLEFGLEFDRCGSEGVFLFTNTKGLQNIAQLNFDSCGMDIFKILDSSGLSQIRSINCKYCGFQEFFIDGTYLSNVKIIYFYKCGLNSKIIFDEPKNYPNLQELILDGCAVNGDIIIKNTRGLENIKRFNLSNCSTDGGQVFIQDVSFVKRIKTIEIQNCSLKNPFIIEDIITPLTLDETRNLFYSLNRYQNGVSYGQAGRIKIKLDISTMTLSKAKLILKKEIDSLTDKGWQINFA